MKKKKKLFFKIKKNKIKNLSENLYWTLIIFNGEYFKSKKKYKETISVIDFTIKKSLSFECILRRKKSKMIKKEH